MSAYMVDREHVRYLIEAARSRRILRNGSRCLRWLHGGEWKELTDLIRAAEVGQMLWDENFASVTYRYSGDTFDNLPGRIGENYVYSKGHSRFGGDVFFEPAQVLKSCRCYSYQSCEHPGWETSEAKAFVDALEAAACRAIIGYEDAEWGAPQACYGAVAR